MSSIIRLGAIGNDSSHLPEFTKRIKALHDAGQTRCSVTRLWSDRQPDMPAEQTRKWQQSAIELGAQPADTMDELLNNVDGVMLLAVNGNKHLRLALPALKRGLPIYIDKPLTCSLAEAKELLSASRASRARCYSASSLRFAAEVAALPRDDLGQIHAIDAFGPGELSPAMKGLFYYGVHTIEMVDAIWGPGVRRVSGITLADRDLLDLEYHDGRYARLRMERKGAYEFGATVHGEKAVHQFRVSFTGVYDTLIQGMIRFFEGGAAPAALRDIVENVAVMEAGNQSIDRGGEWIEIPPCD